MKSIDLKRIIRHFFLAHMSSIIVFSVIYYVLMTNLDKHFTVTDSFKKIGNHKILDCITLSASIQSTNGSNDISPASFLCKSVMLIQYIMIIIISGYFISA